jgi:hypothetical protein
MPVQFHGFGYKHTLAVSVTGPPPANRLLIVTGTALMAIEGTGDGGDFDRDTISFVIASLGRDGYLGGAASAGLASITYSGRRVWGVDVQLPYYFTPGETLVGSAYIPSSGWAVDGAELTHDGERGDVTLTANIALRAAGSVMLRISFQASLLIAARGPDTE